MIGNRARAHLHMFTSPTRRWVLAREDGGAVDHSDGGKGDESEGS